VSVYCTTSFSVYSRRRTELPIIYPDLRLDYKVATHPHILVDTLGLLVANRVEPADTSDRRAGALLLDGLSALFPRIRTVIADAGHQSLKLARTLKQDQGWQLGIVKRRQRAFKITGLTWILNVALPGWGGTVD
jgi:transposase